jgi:hypothetical protein
MGGRGRYRPSVPARTGEAGSLPERAESEAGEAEKHGRYWARTSDPQLVELVLSQLS